MPSPWLWRWKWTRSRPSRHSTWAPSPTSMTPTAVSRGRDQVSGIACPSRIAAPAMAKQVVYNPGYCSQFYPNANCQNKGLGNPYTGNYQRELRYHGGVKSADATADWNYGWNDGRYRSGFWPGDVAAGVVGGAVGTAGAIATGPFRGVFYAFYGGQRGMCTILA